MLPVLLLYIIGDRIPNLGNVFLATRGLYLNPNRTLVSARMLTLINACDQSLSSWYGSFLVKVTHCTNNLTGFKRGDRNIPLDEIRSIATAFVGLGILSISNPVTSIGFTPDS